VADRLLGAIREALRREQSFLGAMTRLRELAEVGVEVREVRKVERGARRAGAAHLCERCTELVRRLAEPALPGPRDREVVHRLHEQLGVGRGRQRLAYLIEHLDRGLELSEVEVRAGLALQEPGADLD